MKRTMQYALGLVLVMGLVASLMPASASCGGARAVTSVGQTITYFSTPGNPFQPTGNFPVSPYGGSATYYVNGIFWSFGGGNPIYGQGNDSGYFKGYPVAVTTSTWLGGGYFGGFDLFLGGQFGHWQYPGVDGCVDLDGSVASGPDPNECNIVVLTDEANETGYFTALSVPPNAGADFLYNASTGFPDQITLAPIPKPTIVSSTTVGNTINVVATVNTGPLVSANGFDFKCQPAAILQGYRIFVRQMAGHDTPKPIQVNTRELNQTFGPPLDPWVPITPAAGTPIGAPSNFSLDCSASGDTDYYLCSTLLFGGTSAGAPRYQLKNCSMNATKIECGPNMANPQAPSMRRIERGSTPTPSKKQGTRSGR